MDKKQQKELENHLAANRDKVMAVHNIGFMFWRKIYNAICPSCKKKLFKDPRMPLSSYCKTCRERLSKLAEEKGFKIK